MMKLFPAPGAAVLAALCTAACTVTGPPPAPPPAAGTAAERPLAASLGVVESVRLVDVVNSTVGAGIVAAAVAGGAVGGQLIHPGQDSGRAAAGASAALKEAIAAWENQQRGQTARRQSYQVVVRFDNGSSQALLQDQGDSFPVGARVRVENGQIRPY